MEVNLCFTFIVSNTQPSESMPTNDSCRLDKFFKSENVAIEFFSEIMSDQRDDNQVRLGDPVNQPVLRVDPARPKALEAMLQMSLSAGCCNF
jgi:hypothetical protein